ncbi:hypothetical protein KFU94_70980 [Chloroflexi bacterium TSY]|nr:hypothetical protein [Chloroflexi bacterium TSY]
MTINTKTSPLIILGFDIGHASSIGRWAQEGHLPTLASIMERGCWGTISSPQQVAEHGAELSLFSGIPQSEHGYYYFRQLQPNTYDLGLILPHETDIRPFWSYLQDQDLKIAILDTAEVAPIKGMRGIHLANWACNQPAFPHLHPSTEPPELLQEVEDFFGPQIFLSEFEPKSSFKQDMDEYHGFLKRVEKKGALCPLLLSRDKFDVIFVQFSEAHTAAHRYWNYHVGTKRAKDSYAKLNNALRNIYQAIDREMGLLLDDLPSDANIVMLAAFGMESQYPTTGLIESFCRELGYQAASAPVGSSPPSLNSRLNPLALARRLIPESLRVAISHHLPTTVQERLLADQFQTATDWQQTTAFAIPSMYTSFIHVNLKGRQPQGIVESGAEYQEVLDRLEDDLKQLIDPKLAALRSWRSHARSMPSILRHRSICPISLSSGNRVCTLCRAWRIPKPN